MHRKYVTQLQGLADTSLAINAATSLVEVLDVLTQRVANLVGAHQAVAWVAARDDGAQAITALHLSDKYAAFRPAGASNTAWSALVCETNRPMRMSEAELLSDPRFRELEARVSRIPPLRGMLAAPLVGRKGAKLGVVQLTDKYQGEFDEEDEAVLVQVAQYASIAVENAHLLEREQRARRHAEASAARIERLQAITAALSNPAAVAEVMKIIVDQATTWLEAEQAAVFTLSADGSHLVLNAHRGLAEETAQRVRLLRMDEEFLATKAVRQRRPLYFETFEDCARESLGSTLQSWRPQTKSVLCVPLALSQALPLGVVAMSFEHQKAFDEHERAHLESLADQWAQAIDRARLHESERTARKQAEVAREQAETADRLKDEFLATISHELRTPLQSILGWARLLRVEPLEPRTDKGLETIERNARAQARLIEDILDASRAITGKLRLLPRTVAIEPIIQASVDTLRAAAQAKHLALSLELDPDLGEIVADPDRLQQVVWNLLSNAVKFTPVSGRVSVRARRGADEITIQIEDSGRGIPREFLPHVFERFRQADASTTRSHAGLGLGLAVVRHLVELHGGRVAAHSEGENHGATFTVHLPVRSTLPPPPASARDEALRERLAPEQLSQALTDKRVLVVDDEPDARKLVVAVFRRAGAHVASAVSVAEALEKVDALQPDLVVTDIAMPGEDGFALLRRLRALGPPRGDLPLLALTAFARADDHDRALLAGFARHLAKPVDPEVLIVTACEILAR